MCVQKCIHTVKSKFIEDRIMINSVLQISESVINESFESTNNVFDEFRLFTSSLFSQIIDWITVVSQSLLK